MTHTAIIDALGLPEIARVDQRIPKKLLLENGAPTAADKRLISEAVDQLQWVAALKPNTVGIAEYKDEQREYLEIAVLTVSLKDNGKTSGVSRISELVHRAIPYPTLLLVEYQNEIVITLANKRWSLTDSSKVVLDEVVTSIFTFDMTSMKEPICQEFLHSLSLSKPNHNLLDLYNSWIASVEALKASKLTGIFESKLTKEDIEARRVALADYERLKAEGERIKVLAKKEKQIARQVELNLSLKRIQNELAVAQLKI